MSNKLILAFMLFIVVLSVYAQDATTAVSTVDPNAIPKMNQKDFDALTAQNIVDAIDKGTINDEQIGWLKENQLSADVLTKLGKKLDKVDKTELNKALANNYNAQFDVSNAKNLKIENGYIYNSGYGLKLESLNGDSTITATENGWEISKAKTQITIKDNTYDIDSTKGKATFTKSNDGIKIVSDGAKISNDGKEISGKDLVVEYDNTGKIIKISDGQGHAASGIETNIKLGDITLSNSENGELYYRADILKVKGIDIDIDKNYNELDDKIQIDATGSKITFKDKSVMIVKGHAKLLKDSVEFENVKFVDGNKDLNKFEIGQVNFLLTGRGSIKLTKSGDDYHVRDLQNIIIKKNDVSYYSLGHKIDFNLISENGKTKVNFKDGILQTQDLRITVKGSTYDSVLNALIDDSNPEKIIVAVDAVSNIKTDKGTLRVNVPPGLGRAAVICTADDCKNAAKEMGYEAAGTLNIDLKKRTAHADGNLNLEWDNQKIKSSQGEGYLGTVSYDLDLKDGYVGLSNVDIGPKDLECEGHSRANQFCTHPYVLVDNGGNVIKATTDKNNQEVLRYVRRKTPNDNLDTSKLSAIDYAGKTMVLTGTGQSIVIDENNQITIASSKKHFWQSGYRFAKLGDKNNLAKDIAKKIKTKFEKLTSSTSSGKTTASTPVINTAKKIKKQVMDAIEGDYPSKSLGEDVGEPSENEIDDSKAIYYEDVKSDIKYYENIQNNLIKQLEKNDLSSEEESALREQLLLNGKILDNLYIEKNGIPTLVEDTHFYPSAEQKNKVGDDTTKDNKNAVTLTESVYLYEQKMKLCRGI